MRAGLVALFAASAGVAFGQAGLNGPDRYPQFRGISGLPGSGVGVTADGRFSLSGALSYTTPIGFTPGKGQMSAVLGLISQDRQFRFFNNDGIDKSEGNGTGTFLVGFDLLDGRAAIGAMLLSGAWDTGLNAQYSRTFDDRIGVAIGIQDAGGGGGSAGTGIPGDARSSMTLYAVTTARFADGVHASVGLGNRRFRHGFMNVSADIGRSAKAVLEHDGWSWNYGFAFGTGPIGRDDTWEGNARRPEATVFLGIIQGRYAGWSLGVSF
ncbi:MAG: hypothetical protein MH204_02595 [Fimbriimonadaceae bacterium]|nr:hypothetical protein [Fimbriimonadaceae bacterium]